MDMCGVDTFGISEQNQSDGKSVLCASGVYKKAQFTIWDARSKIRETKIWELWNDLRAEILI